MNKKVVNHSDHIKSLGICIGASTLSMVTLQKDRRGDVSIVDAFLKVHHGNPQQLFESTIETLPLKEYAKVAVTGRKFRHLVNLTSIPEPEAVEEAFLHINGKGPQVQAIVSAGSETFMLYHLGRDGRISSVHAGNKCASGTGEFFLQQIKRIGIGLEDAVRLARSEEPYEVSGRCSVFCKSDCTHATNKGIPKERVTAGLCQMMAGKILELVKQVSSERIMVIGGCALNTVMIDYLKKEIPRSRFPRRRPISKPWDAPCGLWKTKPCPFPISGSCSRRSAIPSSTCRRSRMRRPWWNSRPPPGERRRTGIAASWASMSDRQPRRPSWSEWTMIRSLPPIICGRTAIPCGRHDPATAAS